MDSRGVCASQSQTLTLTLGATSFNNHMGDSEETARNILIAGRIEGHFSVGTIGVTQRDKNIAPDTRRIFLKHRLWVSG